MTGIKKLTAKQKDILKAAEVEFQKHGLNNAVIDVIVANAQVSKRTLYKYYRSKLDLFQAVLMQKYRAVGHGKIVTYDKGQDFQTQLVALIESEIKTYQDPAYLDVAQIILRELMLSQDKAEKVFAQLPPTGTSLDSWLSAAVNEGYLVCTDTVFAAESLSNHIKSYAFYPQIFGYEALTDEKIGLMANHLATIIMKTYDFPE
jgi:TetR/AcrR family transcriptional regulator of autoinduction and epiphytic fitness